MHLHVFDANKNCKICKKSFTELQMEQRRLRETVPFSPVQPSDVSEGTPIREKTVFHQEK